MSVATACLNATELMGPFAALKPMKVILEPGLVSTPISAILFARSSVPELTAIDRIRSRSPFSSAKKAESDSVNTLPYIARLVDATPTLEMQIVDSDVGRFVMSSYRTPDDRGATPTVVILDEHNEFVGAWIERPAELQDWWLANPDIRVSEKVRQKQVWYDEDAGEQTLQEILALIAAAERH